MEREAQIQFRQAGPQDAAAVSSILEEAAAWQQRVGRPLWLDNELSPSRIAADIAAGLVVLAEISGEQAGTVKFQLEDPVFWPDALPGEAAYVHRLAVRRRHAGTGLSTALLHWAAARTRSLGRSRLRLDCDASRPRLRVFYERFGFRHHSERRVGPYLVSRYEYDVREPAQQGGDGGRPPLPPIRAVSQNSPE